jgi:hypothetical protein
MMVDDKVVWWLTQLWSWVAVGLVVATGGVAAKRLALVLVPATVPPEKQPFWYKLWRSTIRWHPTMVGALIGLAPGLPAAAWVPDSPVAKAFWFGTAGAVSGQLYAALKDLPDTVRMFVSQRLGISIPTAPTSEPPEPPSDETEIKPPE